ATFVPVVSLPHRSPSFFSLLIPPALRSPLFPYTTLFRSHIPADAVGGLLAEPLLKQFSPRPSPFLRNMVACVGTDYCNLALIETKSRAVALSEALDKTLGSRGNPLTIHWSGCPAGCGNHQAADIGFRGFKTRREGKLVDAVAIYAGGQTGPHAVAGEEILETEIGRASCRERVGSEG